MKRQVVLCALIVLVMATSARAEVSRTFPVPFERMWTVAPAVLRQLGWDIDKADHDIGWITTDSRVVEGEDYGVYAKGTRHRLRLIIKAAGAGKTTVTVERTLFKRERILFIDNDEPLTTTDNAVEQATLAAIGKAL